MRPSRKRLPAFALIFLLGLAGSHADDISGAFGHSQESEAALIGILYDLKQTQDRKPTTVDPGDGYWAVLDEFLTKHWDESVLNRYYRVSRPIYTTQIFIPNMSADLAPKAFGADKTVAPSRWVIHYKGQVSPPAPGTYRFWGSSDDAIAVAVNGKTEMISFLTNPILKNGWKQPTDGSLLTAPLTPGDWFHVRANQIIDLDVIIGERPGGWFNAFLMVEKQGGVYPKDGGGRITLPIFQVATYDTPIEPGEPPFAKGFPAWKSYQ